ncbi:hypothetical protein SAMN04487983_101399 [Streptomyces sp. yr375]|uniref:GTP-binding protein n=1 Tax=Streptomyces sp. yr375 TaxID=1761906 RepID=UPI0008C9F7FE|nr:ATP/GTP-binding protein [Streptomyces sp. yr375]SER25459.1 hypothetical protein SAMN04487983_101399 [Streptomyces sp. yr375]
MPGSDNAPEAVKILISGGFGVGKTTMVAAISEITPLRTEERLTAAGVGVDDVIGVEAKTTTTVALDFGRITLTPDLVLYLFGAPGQQRFWFMWNDLAVGALGGIVLVDTWRLESSFAAIDFFEKRGIPFVVAVNRFEGRPEYGIEQIRGALALPATSPLHMFDARERGACRDVLLSLVDHVLAQVSAPLQIAP